MAAHDHMRRQNLTHQDSCWPHLPARVRSFAMGLLTQQCWLWGRDVCRAEGNALIQYGFVRNPAPTGVEGGSAYRCDRTPERTVVLWPFGLFYGNSATEGLYLGRYAFLPLLLPALDTRALPHMPNQLPVLCTPQTQTQRQHTAILLQAMLSWIIEYETWAMMTLGLDYRQQCVDEWKRGPFRLAAERIVPAWHNLAAQCMTHHARYLTPDAYAEPAAP